MTQRSKKVASEASPLETTIEGLSKLQRSLGSMLDRSQQSLQKWEQRLEAAKGELASLAKNRAAELERQLAAGEEPDVKPWVLRELELKAEIVALPPVIECYRAALAGNGNVDAPYDLRKDKW